MAEIYADRKSDNAVLVRIADPGEDVELKALSHIGSIFEQFDAAAKRRMLAYLNLRYDNQD